MASKVVLSSLTFYISSWSLTHLHHHHLMNPYYNYLWHTLSPPFHCYHISHIYLHPFSSTKPNKISYFNVILYVPLKFFDCLKNSESHLDFTKQPYQGHAVNIWPVKVFKVILYLKFYVFILFTRSATPSSHNHFTPFSNNLSAPCVIASLLRIVQ